ncbi:MAG: hypothetical protein PHQ96_06940, partial [Candidatus Omnitrophica bacterium]|nr:hypothetical protein [Candidatus Omnitrophota bacterium]
VMNGLKNAISSTKDPEIREYRIGFLASIFGFLISFFLESYLNRPDIIIPFWFVFGMAWLLAKFRESEKEN